MNSPVSLWYIALMIVVMMLVMFSMGLAACDTIAGAGKDVQKAGEKIEDKAEKCQDGNC